MKLFWHLVKLFDLTNLLCTNVYQFCTLMSEVTFWLLLDILVIFRGFPTYLCTQINFRQMRLEVLIFGERRLLWVLILHVSWRSSYCYSARQDPLSSSETNNSTFRSDLKVWPHLKNFQPKCKKIQTFQHHLWKYFDKLVENYCVYLYSTWLFLAFFLSLRCFCIASSSRGLLFLFNHIFSFFGVSLWKRRWWEIDF